MTADFANRVRPHDAATGADTRGMRVGSQDGGGGELPERAVCGAARGSDLAFRVFDKLQTVEAGEVVENKRLSRCSRM